MLDLLKAYKELYSKISSVDFKLLWRGFEKTKFAVYTDTEACFDGKNIEKPTTFIGNTSVLYNGEDIAIWKLTEPYDLDIIASKVIHEMFHAFQKRFPSLEYPNELEATRKYRYSAENLSIKFKENLILGKLTNKFELDDLREFCALRKYRLQNYPYETDYEIKVERIEGSANYVELCALHQISEKKYLQKLSSMIQNITNVEALFPVRIISYDIGALLIKAVNELGENAFTDMSSSDFLYGVLNSTEDTHGAEIDCEIAYRVEKYYDQTREMIKAAIDKNDRIEIENSILSGYNIYNARYVDGFVLTSFFMMYQVGEEEHILYGDFAVEIDENMGIKSIYRTELQL